MAILSELCAEPRFVDDIVALGVPDLLVPMLDDHVLRQDALSLLYHIVTGGFCVTDHRDRRGSLRRSYREDIAQTLLNGCQGLFAKVLECVVRVKRPPHPQRGGQGERDEWMDSDVTPLAGLVATVFASFVSAPIVLCSDTIADATQARWTKVGIDVNGGETPQIDLKDYLTNGVDVYRCLCAYALEEKVKAKDAWNIIARLCTAKPTIPREQDDFASISGNVEPIEVENPCIMTFIKEFASKALAFLRSLGSTMECPAAEREVLTHVLNIVSSFRRAKRFKFRKLLKKEPILHKLRAIIKDQADVGLAGAALRLVAVVSEERACATELEDGAIHLSVTDLIRTGFDRLNHAQGNMEQYEDLARQLYYSCYSLYALCRQSSYVCESLANNEGIMQVICAIAVDLQEYPAAVVCTHIIDLSAPSFAQQANFQKCLTHNERWLNWASSQPRAAQLQAQPRYQNDDEMYGDDTVYHDVHDTSMRYLGPSGHHDDDDDEDEDEDDVYDQHRLRAEMMHMERPRYNAYVHDGEVESQSLGERQYLDSHRGKHLRDDVSDSEDELDVNDYAGRHHYEAPVYDDEDDGRDGQHQMYHEYADLSLQGLHR